MLDLLLPFSRALSVGALVGCAVAIGPVLAVRAHAVLWWLIPTAILSLSWLYTVWGL